MARSWFGGTNSDYVADVYELGQNEMLLSLKSRPITAWSDIKANGGVRYTDLLDLAGQAISVLDPSAVGKIPAFQCEDGVNDRVLLSLDNGDTGDWYVSTDGLAAANARVVAEEAAAIAEAARVAVEGVVATSDGIMFAVADDPDSAFSQKQAATFVGVEDLSINAAKQAGTTDSAKLQAAIDAANVFGGFEVFIPDTMDLGSTGVTVPQGVRLRGAGAKRSVLAYSGTSGFALIFTGSTQQDSRRGGGATGIAVSITQPGGSGVLLEDCRDIDLDVRVLGGGGTTARNAAFGIRLHNATAGLGCSWNNLKFYIEYCQTGLSLDAGDNSPNWVTRNNFDGHIQSCDVGVNLTDASTNAFQVHPQSCTEAWVLDGTVGADTNDIYTVCEGCTTDWTANAASQNNRVRGSFTVGTTNLGTNTTFQATLFTQLPSYRIFEWDPGAAGNFLFRPAGGVQNSFMFYTRNNASALTQMLQLDGGIAAPRLRSKASHLMEGELEIDGALNHDGTTAGFYGAAPVAKAAAPGTATGTDAAVINAVVTALRNLGLVT